MHRLSGAVALATTCRASGFLVPQSARALLSRGGGDSKNLSMSAAETDKVLYALGAALAQQSDKYRGLLSQPEAETVMRGYKDAFLGAKLEVDVAMYVPKVNDLLEERASAAGAKAAEAGKAFLAAAAAEPGAVQTKSGLVITAMKEGTGASPTAADTVTVHYHGTLPDGTVFDSSVARGQPTSFPLGGVIRGWTEGLQLMKVGGKSKLTIPPELAYGDAGTGPIPPSATLQFEVELLSIK